MIRIVVQQQEQPEQACMAVDYVMVTDTPLLDSWLTSKLP